ncbi:MAG: putative sulfate exporter family transporter [Deltaproteobacteria bacterium]|nr:putative sulfate exporter family transporter [Deltaproteobacteria bacterium]
MLKNKVFKSALIVLALLSFHPQVSSALALITGLLFSLVLGNPYLDSTRKLAPKLLAWSVIGLGAGMNLKVVFQVGMAGIGYTVIGIFLTLLLGWILGKWIQTGRDSTILISVGTAICGGSAIAAVASVIQAKSQDVSLSLVVVFFLNASALILFPWLGHHFHLSQTQFGLFSALAIHDTSSVVGSAAQFGTQALEVATTVKLTRALWIIPVALSFALIQKREGKTQGNTQFKKPWFILGFLATAAIVTFIPEIKDYSLWINHSAKRLLVVTLFLIGTNCPRSAVKDVGVKPLILGIALWMIVSTSTLGAIKLGWIG